MINRSSLPLAYYPALALVLIAAVTRQAWMLIAVIGYVLLVATMSVAASFRAINQRERHRRWQEKLCVKCAYNLEGNQSGVCPECGQPIIKQEPAATPITRWF
jgi:uncharacterized paraquat-inducible protein A